jgi:hypothetical protein
VVEERLRSPGVEQVALRLVVEERLSAPRWLRSELCERLETHPAPPGRAIGAPSEERRTQLSALVAVDVVPHTLSAN